MKKDFGSSFFNILRIVLSAACVWFGFRASFPLCLLYFAAAVFTFPYFQPFFDGFLKQKMILPLLVITILVSAAFLQYREEESRPMFSTAGAYTLEYGNGTADPLSYITVYPGVDASCNKDIDLTVTGKQNAGCVFRRGIYTQDTELVFTVEDTQPAKITFFEPAITVYEHSDYNGQSNIASVTDPVDGALAYADTESTPAAGTYTVRCSGDLTVPGDYTVYVTAADRHNNVSSASYRLTVLKDGTVNEEIKEQEEEASQSILDIDPDMETEALIRYIRLLYLLQGEPVPEQVETLLSELTEGSADVFDLLELLAILTQ